MGIDKLIESLKGHVEKVFLIDCKELREEVPFSSYNSSLTNANYAGQQTNPSEKQNE
ncbi:hypothetical protein HYU07_07275 [Candidatus Woesearchaeota archaeon]|nr:hypothetical protein [Candidatus Woesearchaeota archaeon]